MEPLERCGLRLTYSRGTEWAAVCMLLLAAVGARAEPLSEAKAQVEAGHYAQALPLVRAEATRAPTRAEVHYLLGLIALHFQDDPEAAAAAFEKAAALDGGSSRYQLALAHAYGMKAQRAGMFGGAALVPKVTAALRRAVELEPQSVEAHLALMQFYVMAPGIVGGSLAKAREEAATILRLDPMRGYAALASIHAHEREDAKAEELYRRALAAPGAPEQKARVHAALGAFYRQHRRLAEAREQLEKSAALQPARPEAHLAIAELSVEQKDWKAALPHLERALALDARFAPALLELGRCREALGQEEEARALYRRYLEERPHGERAREVRRKL